MATGSRHKGVQDEILIRKKDRKTSCPSWHCHSHVRGDQGWLAGENAEITEVTGVLQQAKSKGRTQETK